MEKKKSSTLTSSPERGTKSSSKTKRSKAREEEERRLEEEARLKAEQEEKERKEREIRLAEEQRIREKKIIELKNRELNTFYDFINEISSYLNEYNKKRRSNSKWLRYMKCDGSPDPSIPMQINTFLTLWKDDKEHNQINDSLLSIDLVLKTIDEIEFLIEDLPQDESNSDSVIERYKQSILNLENLSLIKMDEASHKLLLNASHKIDPETLNFDFSHGNDSLYYCIWANLSHNPKNKEFQFTKKNFSFILPRPLTLANVTIRALFMNFDMFSSRSKTYECRVKNTNFDFDPIPELKSEPEKEEKKSEALSEDDFLPPELKALMAKNSKGEDEQKDEQKLEVVIEETHPEETKPLAEVKEPISQEELAILQELSDNFVIDLRNYLPIGPIVNFGLYKIPPQTKKIKQWQITQIDESDILKPFKYPIVEHTLPHASWQEYWSRKQEQEYNSMNHPNEQDELGDTIKSRKNDMNLTIKSTDFLESTIGADDTIVSDANKQFLKSFLTKSNEQLVKLMKNEGPVHVNYKLPTNLYYGEAPILARWDEKKEHWRTDEILDFKYNDDTKEIHFKTYHFSPYCLLQDRHVHMPFQLWRMAPRENINTCMFTIETSSFELNIEIKSNELRIYLPNRKQLEEDLNKTLNSKKLSTTLKQKPETLPRQDYEAHNPNSYFMKVVEPIANKWYPLREFKNLLKSIGLNIFPEPDSDKFVTVTNKNKKLEWLAYRNMALCSCLLSFAFSKWNSEINDETKMVILYQLHTNNKEPNSDHYKCLISTNDVFYLSESNENSEEINQDILDGTEEHADLYHLCLDELCKEDKSLAHNRIKQIDPLYYETCLNFLESLKVLTYS